MSTIDFKNLYNSFVEIFRDSTEIPPSTPIIIEGLDENGNVPMVAPSASSDPLDPDSKIPMTDQVSFGNSAVKTSKPESTEPVGEIQKVEPSKVALEENKAGQPEKDEKWVKTGESIDERLTRYYSEYKDANPERKLELLERYITGHYKTLKGSHSEKIGVQLADYKKLIHNTTDKQSYEHLARAIEKLEQENQCPAADSILNDGATAELRKAGGIALGDSLPKFHKDNQIPITEKLIATEDEEIINSAASKASELHEDNQVQAVELFRAVNLESTDNIIVSQYEKFAQENLTDIHKIMSTSEFESVLENILTQIENMPEDKRQEFYDVLAEKQLELAQNAEAQKIEKKFPAQQLKDSEQTYTSYQPTTTESKVKNNSTDNQQIATSTSESRKIKARQEREAKFSRMTTQEKFAFFDKFSERVSTNTKERICSRAISLLSPTQRQQAANGSFGSTMQQYVLTHPDKCNIDLEQVYASADSATKKFIIKTVQTNPFYKPKMNNPRSQLGQHLLELQELSIQSNR